MHTMDTMGYGHKKYRPPISPTSFYQPDYYSRHTTLRPQSEYRFAGYPRANSGRSSRSGGLCSAALVGGALLAAVAVLAVAALAFYMGALRPDNGEPMMSFEGTMRVTRGDVYGGAPGSPAWRERARRYTMGLRQVYAAPSDLRQAFAGAIVTGFGDRSLDVRFKLYLDRRKIPNSVSNIEETLKSILVQDINSKHPVFGHITIDTSSIVIKRDLEHTYHSESFVQKAMNESISTNYPKTVPAQNGKEKTLQSRVGVVRKTTLKPHQKDLDEPDIDTENLPVVQGSFQITKTDADITENKPNSSPARSDDKSLHKPTLPPKTITSTKQSTSPSSTTPLTSKGVTTTPKSRPFTITSTLNVKTKTEPTPKRKLDKTTSKPITTSSSNTIKISQSPTSTSPTTSNNVSQILFDLLTNENHYKDLPKIDTLFTVPHVIDNEPWKPITRPYYETSEPSSPAYEIPSKLNAEDRIGVAEVVEDISDLENPGPSIQIKEQLSQKPGNLPIFGIISNSAADHTTSPVYTSFTLPTYAPPFKEMETLGSSFPKPHPIPVDKISSVVEGTDTNFNDKDDGKPVERPPKEKKSSVTINILQNDQQDNSTEEVLVDGTSIIKIHNNSSPNKNNTISTNDATVIVETLPKSTTVPLDEQLLSNTSKENYTKRPNDKVSVIPTTNEPIHSWELVNTSTNDNDTFNKSTPEKHFNDTLQAIITKNDAMFPNTTPKFQSKNSILRNLTDIIKKYTHNTTEEPSQSREDFVEDDTNDQHNENKMTGFAEVVLDEEIPTTSARVITLLPAKSNLAVNRPLRPRPKIKNQSQDTTENMRSFYSNDMITVNISNNANPTKNTAIKSEIHASKNQDKYEGTDDQIMLTTVTDKIKIEDTDSNTSSKRLPKTSEHFNNPNDKPATENKDSDSFNNPDDKPTTENNDEKTTNIPDGTYKVSYHVSSSVSSKQANKTKSLPAYELSLEPDVVLEIPVNHSNTLTVDKLKQLANLATISSTGNNSIFRVPGSVIFTKAIPSTYNINQAGFKVLNKIYNKLPPESEKPVSVKNLQEKHKISAKDVNNEQCNNTSSFHCVSGLCLPLTSRCNRLLDCPGGEDEHACSCADYLRAELSQSKICDGIVDCWDYSDENKCDWCEEGQYVCANARQCVDMTRVCDGTSDCLLGDDEKSCIALGDDIESNEVIPYNEEGFLMVRKRGVWGRLCVDSFSEMVKEAHSFLKLPDLGRAVCRAMTFQESPWAREAREGRSVSNIGYWEVWHNKEARAAETRLTFRRASCPRHRALRVRCDHLSCGIRPHADAQQPRAVTSRRWSRVVGGGGAAAGAWPWAAALYREGEFQCGGTLISQQWLLSASHCFYQVTEANWVARLGALRRGSWPRAPWEHVTRVLQVVTHPRYAALGFLNDIALLRVAPVPMHARLRPACLPPSRAAPPAGHHCTVIGWGQLYEHEKIFPDTLQEVELPVMSTAECHRHTRGLPLYRITPDMFCAGYEHGGHDACLGDSGGPLMCQEKADNKWYIHGITSNGYGCARANRPGVYTKVSHYIEWINSVMEVYTPSSVKNDTYEDEIEESEENDFSDLETSENRRDSKISSCKGHRCPLGECLPPSSVCNGFIECSDGSDEWQCSKTASNISSIAPD